MEKTIAKTDWSNSITLPPKEPHIEYAFMVTGSPKVHECSKEHLIWELENSDLLAFITTPEHNTFVVPGTDVWSLEPHLKRKKKDAVNRIFGGLIASLIFGCAYWFLDRDRKIETFSLSFGYFFIYGVLNVFEGFYGRYRYSKMTLEEYKNELSELDFKRKEKIKSVVIPLVFAVVFIAIYILQYIGINGSVLSKEFGEMPVWEGGNWSGLTNMFQHDNFFSISLNSLILVVIGIDIIRITGYYHFVLVFLMAGLLGDNMGTLLFSYNSVGISGSIMGLAGFSLILIIKLKDVLTLSIRRHIVRVIVYGVVWGVFAWNALYNPAPTVGLVVGLVMGLIFIKKGNVTIPYKESKTVKVLGAIATVILLLGVAKIVSVFFAG